MTYIVTDLNSGCFFALDVEGWPTLSPMLDDAELFEHEQDIHAFANALHLLGEPVRIETNRVEAGEGP